MSGNLVEQGEYFRSCVYVYGLGFKFLGMDLSKSKYESMNSSWFQTQT